MKLLRGKHWKPFGKRLYGLTPCSRRFWGQHQFLAREKALRLYQLSGIEVISVHSVLVLCSCVPFVVEQSSAVFGYTSFALLYLFARDADDTVFIDPS